MSEEGSGLPVKDLTSTSFGYVIGFLLPGLFGLYALSFWFVEIRDLLKPATGTDATIGPSFFLLLSALTTGLIISALRFFIYEKWICRRHHFEPDMFKKLAASDKLTAFKAVVDEHYRYHQFYGGCSVALFVLFPKWLWGIWPSVNCLSRWILILAFIVFQIILGRTAWDSFVRYIQRGNAIVNS